MENNEIAGMVVILTTCVLMLIARHIVNSEDNKVYYYGIPYFKLKFALLPTRINNSIIWLRTYYLKGYYWYTHLGDGAVWSYTETIISKFDTPRIFEDDKHYILKEGSKFVLYNKKDISETCGGVIRTYDDYTDVEIDFNLLKC